MKTTRLSIVTLLKSVLFPSYLVCMTLSGYSQMPPPGYERAVKIQEEQSKLSPLERDSIVITDTVIVFDPTTYAETTTITNTKYSLKYFCKEFLRMQDPDILLDRKPHTIVNPITYEDLIIRLNESGKIDTLSSNQ